MKSYGSHHTLGLKPWSPYNIHLTQVDCILLAYWMKFLKVWLCLVVISRTIGTWQTQRSALWEENSQRVLYYYQSLHFTCSGGETCSYSYCDNNYYHTEGYIIIDLLSKMQFFMHIASSVFSAIKVQLPLQLLHCVCHVITLYDTTLREADSTNHIAPLR